MPTHFSQCGSPELRNSLPAKAHTQRHQPCVHIVLLNWNGWKDTLECMRSMRCMEYQHWHAIVVDNGSTDDSVLRLKEGCPEAIIVETHKNLGFAAGNNVGIRLALQNGADYVFVLNNDTRVFSDTLAAFVKCAEMHPEAALLGPRIERHNPQREWPVRRTMDLATVLCAFTGLRRLVARVPFIRNIFYCTGDQPSVVQFLPGSALFFRAESFERTGLFDESTFLDFEELIIAEKIRRAGFSAYFVPQARIWHKGSASAAKLRAKRYIENARSEEYFFSHYVRLSLFGRSTVRLIRFLSYGARALRYRNYRDHFNEFMDALRPRWNLGRPASMKAFTNAVIRRLLSKSFSLWEAIGIHITPNYFESPIPDTRCLKQETWRKRSSLTGIDMREGEQVKLLETFVHSYKADYERFPRSKTARSHEYYVDNGFFEAVDGEILHCMVRHFKPKRVYEVGCGNSTLLTAQALMENEKNGDPPGQLVAFEPSPNQDLIKGFPNLSRLVVSKIEDVPVTVFQELEENDILFLDSSHVLRIAGDVQYEFLEILPKLKPGVVVHVHDIFLPAEYPRKLVMQQRRFFSEQYLLQAFLTFNCKFQVLWASSFMHLSHPDLLERAFDSYSRESRWPGSFWMRRTTT